LDPHFLLFLVNSYSVKRTECKKTERSSKIFPTQRKPPQALYQQLREHVLELDGQPPNYLKPLTISGSGNQPHTSSNQRRLQMSMEASAPNPEQHPGADSEHSGMNGTTEASTSGRPDLSADLSAAIMVQRIYRGHRERRRLADIALLEQEKGW
jgi:hypothetical protein